jgi:hypothetical protein
MGAAVEAHSDFAFGDDDIGAHIDEVAEDLAGLSIVISAHAACRAKRLVAAGRFRRVSLSSVGAGS